MLSTSLAVRHWGVGRPMLQKRQPMTVGGGQSAEGEGAGGPRLHSWIAQVLGWLGEEDQ